MSTLPQNANMDVQDCKSCPYFFVLNQNFIFDADLQGSPAIHPGRDIQYSQVRPYSHHDNVANAGEPWAGIFEHVNNISIFRAGTSFSLLQDASSNSSNYTVRSSTPSFSNQAYPLGRSPYYICVYVPQLTYHFNAAAATPHAPIPMRRTLQYQCSEEMPTGKKQGGSLIVPADE